MRHFTTAGAKIVIRTLARQHEVAALIARIELEWDRLGGLAVDGIEPGGRRSMIWETCQGDGFTSIHGYSESQQIHQLDEMHAQL